MTKSLPTLPTGRQAAGRDFEIWHCYHLWGSLESL
jgi:hypothetical protein